MITIHLHNLNFYSFHGLYSEEILLGGRFEVNMDVYIDINEKITHISQTVDYVSLYNIISEKMNQPTPLLETLAENISESVFKKDERIKKVNINIVKLSPPIPNFQGKLGITYSKEK